MTTVDANGIEIYYDEFGEPGDPTLLLIAGLGAQCTRYDDALVMGFVDRGFRVIRYDNRDAGLSTLMPDDASYTLSDMAADGIGLLDVLGVEQAHLWGSSMGGMIAQTMAIEHPDRVATLTSVMSNTGEPDHGAPEPELLESLLASAVPASNEEEALVQAMNLARSICSPDYFDDDEQLARNRAFIERSYRPAGTGRQVMAVFMSGSRAEGLAALRIPTLVVHGDKDRLVTPSGGRRTAELVQGSVYLEFEGMAHDLPSPFWPQYVEATTALVAAAV